MFVGNTLGKIYGCRSPKVEELEREKTVKDESAACSAELIEKLQT